MMKILHRPPQRARLFAAALLVGASVLPLGAAVDDAVFYRSTSDWGAGVVGEFTLSNRGATDLASWTLEFDLSAQIANMWGGQIVSHEGTRYVIKPMPWNQKIYPGSRTVVGFQAMPGGVQPANVRFVPRPMAVPTPTPAPAPGQPNVDIAFKINSDWDAGAQLDAALTNKGADTLENWTLEFDLPQNITSIWNATVVSHKDARYRIDASAFAWNKDIAPGATVRFGFITQPGSLEGPPQHVKIFGTSTPSPLPPPLPTATPTPAPTAAPPSPSPTATPPAPRIFNYAEALQKSLLFYEAQRSGPLPADRRIRWRGDSALDDGADAGVDLTGGYYDAGDHVKFALPLCSSLTLLAWGGIQYPQGFKEARQWNAYLGTVRWGLDWVMKAHIGPDEFYGQVGDADLDHAFWGPPEAMAMPRPSFKIDASKPGTEVAGEAAAALAAGAILFQKEDPAYAAELLRHARELLAFADRHRGTYTDAIPNARNFYNSFTGYYDELAWAAAWLYKATGKKEYLDKAAVLYDRHLKGTLIAWTHSWDDKRYGAAILLAQLTGAEVYMQDAESFLDYWTIGRNGRRINTTSGGLAWLDQWGSLRYAANTAFLAFVYSDTLSDPGGRYRSFAERQINYILGDNPPQRSYVVGFGDNPPVNPHHRAAHGSATNNINDPETNRHVLYGALVGGPSTPDDFSYEDKRTNFITNEVALDYNAGFTGALSRMVMLFGGQPIESLPPRSETLPSVPGTTPQPPVSPAEDNR